MPVTPFIWRVSLMPWCKSVWFPGRIPRASVISWLVWLDKLYTNWGSADATASDFVGFLQILLNISRVEGQPLLCLFSYSINSAGGAWLRWFISVCLLGIESVKPTGCHPRVGRVLMWWSVGFNFDTTCVYFKWPERRSRISRTKQSSPDGIARRIVDTVRLHLLSLPWLQHELRLSSLCESSRRRGLGLFRLAPWCTHSLSKWIESI